MASVADEEKELETIGNEENEAAKMLTNDDDDEDVDETFGERLWGLTEMFPEWLRSGVWTLTTGSFSGIKGLYGFSRSALWIFFSSSAILMAPVIFEVERAQMEEMHKQQQRQILLGPNAAIAGGQPHFPMPIPPIPSQQTR